MTEPGKIKWAFLIACAMETLSASWLLISGIPPVIVSILHVLSGLIIAALFLFIPLAQSSAPAMLRDGHMQVAMKWMMLIVTAIIFFVASKSIFAENPVDYRNADMIPVIRTMNERVLHGNLGQVYSGIPEIWNGSQPIYLPFMWLPFLPAVFMHIDPRWTTVVAL
ncbi:MAG TPA: hypothetical protein VKR32_14405, partial [Puia sp.]|nr:hypothetical protein [Puia sp.]